MKCVYCGSTERLQIDHIIPKHIGGINHPTNYQTLCDSCNSKKKAKVTLVDLVSRINLINDWNMHPEKYATRKKSSRTERQTATEIMPDVLNLHQTCIALECSRTTLWRLIRDGRLVPIPQETYSKSTPHFHKTDVLELWKEGKMRRYYY